MENVLAMKYNSESLVVQANELIRSPQDGLNLVEAKLIRLAISQIVETDTELRTYSCKVVDLAKFIGVAQDNIFRDMEQIIDNLMRRVITIIDKTSIKRNGEYNYKKFHWVDTCYYNSGTITLKLSNELKPYLVGLNELFTRYGYENILKLPTSNSIRLYELLLSYESIVNTYEPGFRATKIFPEVDRADDELIFTINYLKKYFDCIGKYERDRDFVKRVIDSSVNAINKYSPTYRVSYRTARNGRKMGYVLFRVNAWSDEEFREFIVNRQGGDK